MISAGIKSEDKVKVSSVCHGSQMIGWSQNPQTTKAGGIN